VENFLYSSFIFVERSVSCDLQTLGVPPLANKFCLESTGSPFILVIVVQLYIEISLHTLDDEMPYTWYLLMYRIQVCKLLCLIS